MPSSQDLADAAKAAADAAEARYQSLSPLQQAQAKAKRDEALDAYAAAELAILQSAATVSDDDIRAMNEIKAEIDRAADAQQFAFAVGKLVLKLASPV